MENDTRGAADEPEASPEHFDAAPAFGCSGARVMKADNKVTMIAAGPLTAMAALREEPV